MCSIVLLRKLNIVPPIQDNIEVDVGGPSKLQMALNTDQTGRVFQVQENGITFCRVPPPLCIWDAVKRPLSKRQKIGFQDQLSLNAGQKYCRMLQGEHSAILLAFIKLPFVIKIFVLSIFEWLFYTGFTVILNCQYA